MTLVSVPRYRNASIPAVGEHAVVVGASVAGVASARVLDDAFERVTVIDRDSLPDEPDARDGVPQSKQPHILLEAGRATLEDLFPGYAEDVAAAGGLLLDWTTDLTHYQRGGVLAAGPEPKVLYAASRPAFEHAIRRRLAARDGVELRGETQFVDYLADDANDVTGVEVRDADGTESIPADLVVDASGRTSTTPSWLESHGYDAPPVEDVHVDVAYTTAVVERPPDDRRIYFAPPSPEQPRGGGVFPVEGDRWLVTLQGIHGDHPPTDVEGLREYARTLPLDDVAEILAEQPVLGDVAHYPFPSNRRRRYEDLDAFPGGLVVLGDAVASFNPVYGQGMSVACLEAVLLGHALTDGGLDDLPRRFFDRASDVVDVAWLLATTADLAFEETEGERSLRVRLVERYVSRVVETAHEDGEVASTYGRVLSMEVPPAALLRPRVAARVLPPSVGNA